MLSRVAFVLAVLGGCARPSGVDTARDDFIVDTLALDNREWALREPDLVRAKLAKMQREPFLWLRGTPAVFWREAMVPGARTATTFGDDASSRVLLVGDPHPENIGTFLAPDGTFTIEWNDFDGAGYGPFELDVLRLATGMIVATGLDGDPARALARAIAAAYATRIADLAAGRAPTPLAGGTAYLDKLIAKATANGDAGKAITEAAPIGADGTRAIAFGDIDPVAPDGVIEFRLQPVGAEADVWNRRAIDRRSGGTARVKLECRRIGSGVSSYAALRYYVVLEGATDANDDDAIVELKEERDGLVVAGVPRYAAAEWQSPGVRVVDVQRRLQSRPDADARLGEADVGALSIRIHDHEAYQRGVNAVDLAPLDGAEQLAIADRFGALLANAHGAAATADHVPGWSVLAPVIGDRAGAFADELAGAALADADRLRADFDRLASRDLASLIIPRGTE